MHTYATCALTAAALLLGVRTTHAADAAAGKTVFLQRCSTCHTAEANDGGGAQGPPLAAIYGKPAARDSQFSYTKALRNAHLSWDADTLDRFLAAPAQLVPGTAMVTAVPQDTERRNLIAYLQHTGTQAAQPSAAAAASAGQAQPAARPDWEDDAPGRPHHIDPTTLPPPFATPSARNRPHVVPRPPGAQLALPPGFQVDVFATQLLGPRRMIVAPNADVLVSETRGGRISILRPAAQARTAASRFTFAENLREPYGMAFYPDAVHPEWLYVAETNRIDRFPYAVGDTHARGVAEVIVPELPSGGGHYTRDIVFAPDHRHLFVSVGSGSNVAQTMPRMSAPQLAAWQGGHALGAAWDSETDRAAVLVFDAESGGTGRIFAAGIRNCVSLALQPVNEALWCTTNERDGLGDDLVPDYSTHVRQGAFYGWPWYYIGPNEDPRHKAERPDLAGSVTIPDVLYQAHSAPLNLTFYTATSGKSAFPAEYRGDAFVTLHGSWNRSSRTGHKLVRVRMRDGVASGEYDDFLTGFILDDGNVWGRPVATVVLPDGSLLMSDDGADLVYRISYGQ